MVGTIIGALFAGIIIGPLARLALPGRQNISLGMTILVGAIGAFVGGIIAQWIGVGATGGIDWIRHAIQVAVAAGAIVVYLNVAKGKS